MRVCIRCGYFRAASRLWKYCEVCRAEDRLGALRFAVVGTFLIAAALFIRSHFW